VIGTLAVDGWAVTYGTTRRGLGGQGVGYEVQDPSTDGWAVTFGTARRGLIGAAARPGPASAGLSSLYQV